MIALTLHNLFGRHPNIKVVSIENGSNWLKPLFKTVDKAAALGRRGDSVTRKVLRGNTARLLRIPDKEPALAD